MRFQESHPGAEQGEDKGSIIQQQEPRTITDLDGVGEVILKDLL